MAARSMSISVSMKGQFMSGAVAGVINSVSTIDELHHELAEGRLDLVIPKFRTGSFTEGPSSIPRNESQRASCHHGHGAGELPGDLS